jgi:Flp pilus assembly protein TadG
VSRPRPCRDRGASVVETTLAFAALLTVVLVLIQTALLMHARHVAQSAAADAARAAAGYRADAADGRRAGYDTLTRVAPRLLTHPQVNVTRADDIARAEVSAGVLVIVPGLAHAVHESATSRVEQAAP